MYFQLHINPIGERSSDAVVADNFHPRWKEGVEKMMSAGKIIPNMGDYAERIAEWSKVSIELMFDDQIGLKHISLSARASHDLIEDDLSLKYRSHNING